MTLKGQKDYVNSIAFSENGNMLAIVSKDGELHIRDTVIGKCVQTLTKDSVFFKSVAFSPDGMMLASSSGRTVMI